MYSLVYNFLRTNLFNSNIATFSMEIFGVNTSMADWLANTFTIITMILFYVCAVLFIKWLFKLVAGMFTGIGR